MKARGQPTDRLPVHRVAVTLLFAFALMAAVNLGACASYSDAYMKQVADAQPELTDVAKIADDPQFAELPAGVQQRFYNSMCHDAVCKAAANAVRSVERACPHATPAIAAKMFDLEDQCLYKDFKADLDAWGSNSKGTQAALLRLSRMPASDGLVAQAKEDIANRTKEQQAQAVREVRAEQERKVAVNNAIPVLKRRYRDVRGMSADGFVGMIVTTTVNAWGMPVFAGGRIEGKTLTLYTPALHIVDWIVANAAPYDQVNDEFVAWCGCDGRTDIVLSTYGTKTGLVVLSLGSDGPSEASFGAFRAR